MAVRNKFLPTPLKPFGYKIPGKAAKETYAELVAAWRAGTVFEFRCGARSEDDPTIVWSVDGAEFAKSDTAGVKAAVAAGLERAGIVSAVEGPAWCGYQSLTVTYATGWVHKTYYDGTKVVYEAVAPAEELVA